MSSSEEAVLCLSGGLDSAAQLALYSGKIARALFFDYGQVARAREWKSAQKIAAHFQVELLKVDLSFFSQFSSGLISGDIPTENIEIDSLEKSETSAKGVWVPNRNGIFANVAAGVAENEQIGQVLLGLNKEEAATFPDNSQEFLTAATRALRLSTQNGVKLGSTTIDLDKSGIVAKLKEKEFPFALLWSCYFAENKWCGRCESCRRLARALSVNGIDFNQLRDENEKQMA